MASGVGSSAITGCLDAGVGVGLHLRAARFGRRAVQHQLVDHLVGDRRRGAGSVAGRPGRVHRRSASPRPSQSWKAAYAGTVR